MDSKRRESSPPSDAGVMITSDGIVKRSGNCSGVLARRGTLNQEVGLMAESTSSGGQNQTGEEKKKRRYHLRDQRKNL